MFKKKIKKRDDVKMGEESAAPRTGGDWLGDGMVSLIDDSSCFEVSRQEEGIEESGSRFSGGEFVGNRDVQIPVSTSAVDPLICFVTVTTLMVPLVSQHPILSS